MIATAQVAQNENHEPFLAMMPVICGLARRRFSHLPMDQREEAVAEAVAAGFVAFLSLKRRDRLGHVRTAGFARNAVRAAANGRRVGSSQCSTDVLSVLGRRRHGRPILSLDVAADGDDESAHWLHEAVEKRGTAIPDKVALRVDGGRWLASLPTRDQRAVAMLAAGEKACEVARDVGISPARLTQLRQEWAEKWLHHVGDAA